MDCTSRPPQRGSADCPCPDTLSVLQSSAGGAPSLCRALTVRVLTRCRALVSPELAVQPMPLEQAADGFILPDLRCSDTGEKALPLFQRAAGCDAAVVIFLPGCKLF